MNKKGKIDTPMEMIPSILYALFAFIVLGAFLWLLGDVEIETDELTQGVVDSRFIISPSLLAYEDPYTGRAYPGIIDMNKLTNEHLEFSLSYQDSKRIVAKVSLLDHGSNEVKVAYVQEKWYKTWKPTAETQTGPGSATLSTRKYPVIYEYEDETYNGFLEIEVITTNT